MEPLKKVLLFDLSAAQSPKHGSKYGGMILYSTAIFIKLVRKLRSNIDLKVIYIPENYMIPLLYDICREHHIEMIEATETTLIDVVNKIKPDLFFTPNPTKRTIIQNHNIKMLTVCHDIRTTEIYFDPLYWRFISEWKDWVFLFDSIVFKGYFQKKNMMNISKRYIGHDNIFFIAVSQHTKHHVIVHFPQYRNKEIKVFFSPMLELLSENMEEASFSELPRDLRKGKYFFMDSGWRWSKNDLRAAIALDSIFSDYPNLDYKVVITGVKNKNAYFPYLKNRDKFILLQYVERDMLNTLHKEARATIYPTLGEGFGYTPMESFKYGVPVIAACNSSVPEVCGDAALYVNPYSIQELKNRCLQMLDDKIHSFYAEKSLPRYEFIRKEQLSHLEQFVEYIQDMTTS